MRRNLTINQMKKSIVIIFFFFSIIANGQSRNVTISFSEDNVNSDSLRVFNYDTVTEKVIEIKGEKGVFNLLMRQYFIIKTKNHIVSIPSVDYDYPIIDIKYFSNSKNELAKFYGEPPKTGNTFYIHLGGCEDMFITTQRKKSANKLTKLIMKL